MKRIPFILLLILLALQCLSGMGGGIAFLADVSGGVLQMDTGEMQPGTFSSFLIPGLALFILLGIVPGLAFYGLLAKPAWRWAEKLNIYPTRHWSWAFSLYTGIMLVIWIDVQITFVSTKHILQTIYLTIGVLIIILTLAPPVMKKSLLK